MSLVDQYRIDGHKLHLHPRRVADWLEGREIAPIYMEISPSGACNHRCSFCGLDFMGYKPRFLSADILCERLREMGEAGLKSVMFAGEGEPFLHREMGAIAIAAKRAGIDVAFTTNAVNLREDAASAVLPVTSWIKVSFNAGTPKTYARIHGTQEKDYAAVLSNMERAVRLRAELGSSCTLGFQMVLLPENWDEAAQLAKTVRDIGADYLVIKPYSQNPQSHTQKYAGVSYEKAHELAGELEVLNNTCFSVIFRYNTMERSGESHKPYNRCLALPFWAYMDAGGCIWGCIWGCSSFLVEAGFNYGNILEQSFADIWHGEQRRKNLAWVADHLDASTCRINCRMDTINAYLWELKHPGGHVNFI